MDEKLYAWVHGHDRGTSSETLWEVATGERIWGLIPDVPHDPQDFGRCHRMLELLDEVQGMEVLEKTAEKYPKWKPLVREWRKMTIMYLRDLPTGESTELYELMKKLIEEGEECQD